MPDQTLTPLSDADRLDQYEQGLNVSDVRQTILGAPSDPDVMAKQTRISRQLGVAPHQIEGVLPQAQNAVRAQNIAAVAEAHPTIGTWAANNPRQAVAASDDHKSLGLLGSAWDQVKAVGQSLATQAALYNPLSMGMAAINSIERATGYAPGDLGKSVVAPSQTATATIARGVSGLAVAASNAYSPIQRAQTGEINPLDVYANRLDIAGKQLASSVQVHGNLSKGAELVGGVLPFAMSGEFAPLTMGASGAGQQVEAAQKSGKPVSTVGMVANAAYQATIGHVFGMLGNTLAPAAGDALGSLVARSVARTSGDDFLGMAIQPGAEKLGDFAARMVGSAGLGYAMQSGSNLIEQQTVNPNRSINESTGDSALSMIALDLLTHGLHAALGGHDAAEGDPTAKLAQTGQAILPGITRAAAGLHDAAILDGIDRAASDSKFKARDPEGYSALAKFLGQDAGIENVHVDPAAIRAYQQSDSYDRYNDPFAAHEDAIHEAEVSGGDVALPTEFVTGDLAGTKAYAAIKDSIRLRPDGMTGKEARTQLDQLPEQAKATFDALTEQDRAVAKERDARSELVDRVTGEIQNAGFTPSIARTYAEVVGQRVATRAERLGKTMQPGDFDTRIIRVLPPSLEAARKADNLDLAINAMRKGKPAEKQGGKSLLQFIADRGGMNDSGGDLKAMGADAWHREMPGRKKLIREAAQPDMLGGGLSGEGDYGHDTTMRSAVEAGYFPELAGTDPTQFDTNDLHSAISDELSGRPRFAEEAKVDPMRAAGDDLRRMIENEGRDPSGMSDKEIRQFVEDKAKEPMAGGRALEQGQRLTPVTRNGDMAVPVVQIETDHEVSHAEAKQVFSDQVRRVEGHLLTGEKVDFNQFRKAAFSKSDKFDQSLRYALIANMPDIVAHAVPYAETAENASPGHSFIHAAARVDLNRQPLAVRLILKDVGDEKLRHYQIEGFEAVAAPESNLRPESLGSRAPEAATSQSVRDVVENFKGRQLFQSADDAPRGQIKFPTDGWGSGPATIELFAKANLSTLPHELGHQWLEELRFDAQHPDASDQLKSDWDTVQKWFKDNGHPVDGDTIPTDAHEMFARGIERYLMEGKAPTKSMAPIFEKIRGWMVNIYKTVKALGSPITPEIRQVFDLLIATDDEIAAKQKDLSLQPAITDTKALGMSDAESAAYAKLTQGARDEAQSELLAKTMEAVRRQHTAAWNDERKGVRADEAARLEETPLFAALRLMKETPISKAWLVDRMGEDAPGLMPHGGSKPHVREGGAHPDDIAEMAGYSSGEEMIQSLMGAEQASREAKASGDPRSLRSRIIDHAADAEMARRHGDDPFNDGSIEDEAVSAVNNELAGKLLETELRILGRQSGNVAALYSIARTWARDKVRSGTITDEASAGAIQMHARAMAKAGREAEKAIIAGKYDEAFAAKQKQMISSALLREATDARDEVTKAQDALAKIAKTKTRKSVDQDYLDQAHALLDDVQLGPRSQRSIDRQDKWAEWYAKEKAAGRDPVVPASFENTIKGTHWSRLPVDQFLGLHETVDQLMNLGRLKQNLLDNQEEREWSDVRQEVKDGAAQMDQQPPKTIDQIHGADIVSNIKGKIYEIDAMLKKMETIVDFMDGQDPNGVWNRVFFRPLAEAEARERTMVNDLRQFVKETFDAVPKEDAGRWLDRVETPWGRVSEDVDLSTLQRQRVVAMALNVGNEGNLQRLADGYGINRDSITEFLNQTLTKGEWEFVQKMWDKADSYWPELSAMERRVNGVAPDKVEARAVSTPHGELRGGYWPAVYDSRISKKAADQDAMTGGLRSANYMNATTRASSTNARSDAVRSPILLDLGVIERHMSEVIHDISHREAIVQAWKFATDSTMHNAVKRTLGPEYANMLEPFVKQVANSWAMDRVGSEAVGKWLNAARSNMTVAALGFNASTVMVHTTIGLFGLGEIGPRFMMHGLWSTMQSPIESARRVIEMSPEVAAIGQHYDQTINDLVHRYAYKSTGDMVLSKAHDFAMKAREFSMYGISFMVQRMAIISWIGAHAKATSEGMDESDARAYAEKIVRRGSGGHGAKDLPAAMNGQGRFGPAIKLLTAFYTPFAAQYQRQSRFLHDTMNSDARTQRNVPELAARAVTMFILPVALSQGIRLAFGGQGPDKDESWAAWWAKKYVADQAGPIPVAGSAVEPTWDRLAGHRAHDWSITPLQRGADAIEKAAKDVGDHVVHGREIKAPVKDALTAAGYATGLVPGQVAKTTQFMVDVGNGSQQPGNLHDWAIGLQTGHTPAH